MEDSRMNELMESAVSRIRELTDTNTIIGSPIVTPDGITVIPVSRVSFGFATGGTEGGKNVRFTGGNGAGVKVEPVGFFVIKDGNCRMISIAPPPSGTMERIVEIFSTASTGWEKRTNDLSARAARLTGNTLKEGAKCACRNTCRRAESVPAAEPRS